jgi:hypothetical protein
MFNYQPNAAPPTQIVNQKTMLKMSLHRCTTQLSHVQGLFLFCEPRDLGLDTAVMDTLVDLVNGVRRELRQAQSLIEVLGHVGPSVDIPLDLGDARIAA